MARMKKKFKMKGRKRNSALPAGTYPVEITKTEIRETKAKDGSELLYCMFKVMKGPEKGRVIHHNFNLWNLNTTAKEIAEAEFEELLQAIGIKNGIADTKEIHKRPLKVTVILKEATESYREGNEITEFEPMKKKKKKKKGLN